MDVEGERGGKGPSCECGGFGVSRGLTVDMKGEWPAGGPSRERGGLGRSADLTVYLARVRASV